MDLSNPPSTVNFDCFNQPSADCICDNSDEIYDFMCAVDLSVYLLLPGRNDITDDWQCEAIFNVMRKLHTSVPQLVILYNYVAEGGPVPDGLRRAVAGIDSLKIKQYCCVAPPATLILLNFQRVSPRMLPYLGRFLFTAVDAMQTMMELLPAAKVSTRNAKCVVRLKETAAQIRQAMTLHLCAHFAKESLRKMPGDKECYACVRLTTGGTVIKLTPVHGKKGPERKKIIR